MKITRYFVAAIAMPLLIAFFAPSVCQAQELKPGDTLPPALVKMVNPGNKQLVILHFWNTLCKGCIADLRRMDVLQQQFTSALQITLVAAQPETEINDFFTVRKKFHRPRGTILINGDTQLKTHFPYAFVPHHVWLTAEGKILSITSGAHTDSAAIASYLRGIRVELPRVIKQHSYPARPILSACYDTAQDRYHSFLCGAMDSVYQTFEMRKAGRSTVVNRIIINKMTALQLCIQSYDEGRSDFNLNYGNVVYSGREDLHSKNKLYCYDLQVPGSKAGMIYRYWQQDMERAFEITAKVEIRQRKCLTLKFRGDSTKLLSKGGLTASHTPKKTGDSLWKFTNYPMAGFFSVIGHGIKKAGFEWKDATGINGNIDANLSGSLVDVFDLDQLKRDLAPYGFTLEESICAARVLVIQ